MVGRGRGWLAALVVAVAMLAACNGDDADDNGTSVITDPVETTDETTTTEDTSTTETTVDPEAEVEAEVEAAYLAYWDAWLEIFADPNPENPLIDKHTTGTVREVTLDAISEMVLEGYSVRPPDDPADLVTTVLDLRVDGANATLTACLIDGTVRIDSATGDVINDDVGTLYVEATMTRENNAWKVATSDILEQREGRWNCKS